MTKYEKHIGYDLTTERKRRSFPFLDGFLWRWVLYQNGNWVSNSLFHFGTEDEALRYGRNEIKRRQHEPSIQKRIQL